MYLNSGERYEDLPEYRLDALASQLWRKGHGLDSRWELDLRTLFHLNPPMPHALNPLK